MQFPHPDGAARLQSADGEPVVLDAAGARDGAPVLVVVLDGPASSVVVHGMPAGTG